MEVPRITYAVLDLMPKFSELEVVFLTTCSPRTFLREFCGGDFGCYSFRNKVAEANA